MAKVEDKIEEKIEEKVNVKVEVQKIFKRTTFVVSSLCE